MATPYGQSKKQVHLCPKCNEEIQHVLYVDMRKGGGKKKMVKRCGCNRDMEEKK